MTRYSRLETVVRSLDFQKDEGHLLRDIPESAWPELLQLTDEARLTLPLGIRCRRWLPPAVQERVAENLAHNRERHKKVVADWLQADAALRTRSAEYIVLKGLTQWPYYCDSPEHRPQYDLDLYCSMPSIDAAQAAVATLGFEAIRPSRGQAVDHLPAMIRRTGYSWTGDFFDPNLPLVVELHFRFWDSEQESFQVRSAAEFWERRTTRMVDGLEIPALHPVDALSYATWHAVRHLVRGDLRPYHIYEIAHFLDRTQKDESFWREWEQTYRGALEVAEGIAFRLAREWFGCRMNSVATAQIARLPIHVQRWFGLFAFSPIRAVEELNKDEIFLHLSLVPRKYRLRIAFQRILPMNPPRVVLEAHLPAVTPRLKMRRIWFRMRFLASRASRHLRALWPVLRSAVRWWRAA